MNLSTELYSAGVLWTGCGAGLAPAVLSVTAVHCKSRMFLKKSDLVCFLKAAQGGFKGA